MWGCLSYLCTIHDSVLDISLSLMLWGFFCMLTFFFLFARHVLFGKFVSLNHQVELLCLQMPILHLAPHNGSVINKTNPIYIHIDINVFLHLYSRFVVFVFEIVSDFCKLRQTSPTGFELAAPRHAVAPTLQQHQLRDRLNSQQKLQFF